ncbi:OmpW family outer membrane protein [Telmatospirillum sp.]|uniref:OmpW/AlkL family protein n=1 Tax=Telmatospirillum sp. TaxID=2079197 RepID=UPI002843377E|nr:OmpW family outer membrane protein [Telmatospirillum sp.]MDR3436251.1 OmpW family outer membrane protein [Telmatospirillum sp.]
MRSTFKLGIVSAVALLAGVSAAAAADGKVGLGAGDLLVHGRVVGVLTDVRGRDTLLNGQVDADNYVIPELDASYFVTDYISGEIIAGTTRHNVKDKLTSSNLNLGHVWLLPPTLTAQFHPLGRSAIDLYVGAGVNYTIFYGAGGAQNIAGESTKVTYKNGFGTAFQFGANYQVSGSWFANVDVKKLLLPTSADVKLNGTAITHARVNLDPWLVGVGIGYRF